MATSLSRLVIAGLSGDSGKTIASLSFLTALKRKGHSVSVFKKGPDYIDPAWLSMAAQTVCRNLDTYMVDPADVLKSFVVHADESGVSVIEGNRGLFDGRDSSGTNSTAELAKLLGAPVVLVVNTAKTTRTVAAVVKGCLDFDTDVTVAGVILNRVAGKRHLKVIKDSIEESCRVPVLGAIPKLGEDSTLIPGRHLGLVTPSEYGRNEELRSQFWKIADDYLDVDAMVGIAGTAAPIPIEKTAVKPVVSKGARGDVRIGYFRDSVFTFYYPENLEALEAEGARLVPVSSLEDKRLPNVDALYIGGGFPETHTDRLSDNRSMMVSVKDGVAKGLPVYAECGGLIYLARSLECNGHVYSMSGVFPIDLSMHAKPVGHGYSLVRVDAPNPFYAEGTEIRGHEFHYTGPAMAPRNVESCMTVQTGVGLGDGRDGLVRNNTLACYTHVHANGVKDWASAMVSKAAEFAAGRRRGRADKGGKGHSGKSIAL